MGSDAGRDSASELVGDGDGSIAEMVDPRCRGGGRRAPRAFYCARSCTGNWRSTQVEAIALDGDIGHRSEPLLCGRSGAWPQHPDQLTSSQARGGTSQGAGLPSIAGMVGDRPSSRRRVGPIATQVVQGRSALVSSLATSSIQRCKEICCAAPRDTNFSMQCPLVTCTCLA